MVWRDNAELSIAIMFCKSKIQLFGKSEAAAVPMEPSKQAAIYKQFFVVYISVVFACFDYLRQGDCKSVAHALRKMRLYLSNFLKPNVDLNDYEDLLNEFILFAIKCDEVAQVNWSASAETSLLTYHLN